MAQILSNLPVGAKIKFGKYQVNSETAQPIIWVVADKNHSGYPANSVTLITPQIIDLRAFDAKENSYTSGNPNYYYSNINQWLNSSASAGNWYTATHANDNPPSYPNVMYNYYQSRPGFLYNFTEQEKVAILPTTVTNQVGSDVSGKVTAKVFIPSVWEILGTGTVADNSSRLAYFSSNVVTATLTDQAFNNTASTNKPDTVNTKWEYMTRSTNDTRVTYIKSDGTALHSQANFGQEGLRPIVNLSSTVKISDTTDSDGCYTFLVNSLPTISGTNGDLGEKKSGFSTTYSVNDADNENVTVTEYIDNTTVRSYVATRGATNTFAVTGNTWLKLANGTHTLKITATDGFDTTTRVYTFLKAMDKLVVQRSTPIEVSTKPTQIVVTVVKTIPYNARMVVEVCRNGFDANPTWEDIGASSVSSGLPYEFKSTINESGRWGVNIRVTVYRNGGEGACYITEIGGNFE